MPATYHDAERAASISRSPRLLIDAEHVSLWMGAAKVAQVLTMPTDGDGSRQALTDLTIAVHAGDRIALSGPSGSGKSVLLRTLALLDRPASGAVRYLGEAIAAAEVPRYRRAIAYLPQRPSLSGDTVRDALQQPFQLAVHRDRHFDEALALGLLAKAGKPEDFLDKAVANLSGGEAQIAALVRTLILTPDMLLLDEPTAALDPDSALAVEALVCYWFDAAPAERAYVWISHNPDQAQRIGRTQWRIYDGVLSISHDRRDVDEPVLLDELTADVTDEVSADAMFVSPAPAPTGQA